MTGPPPKLDAELIVVFDTNAYLDFIEGLDLAAVDKAIGELIGAERRNGIKALGIPFVMLELIARLNDPASSGYKRSQLALITLAGHCRFETPHGARFGFMHDSATIIADSLYGRKPQTNVESSGKLIELLTFIDQVRPTQLPDWVTRRIARVKEHVDEIEKDFGEMMYRYAVKGPNPIATDWAPLKKDPVLRAQALAYIESPDAAFRFGDMLLQQAFDALEIDETPDRRRELAAWVAENFKTPHRLFNEILRRIFTTGCDITKPHRRNWIWDLHIACSVGSEHTIQEKPIRLITTDGDILAAAESAGCGHLVQSYVEYREGLESGSVSPVGQPAAT